MQPSNQITTYDQALSLENYYFWRGRSSFRYPWARQYLNSEFLSYEIHQIETVANWYKMWGKGSQGDNLEEIRLYSVPIEIKASWKAAIDQHGDYSYIGFSALFNSPQSPVIGLFTRAAPIPQEYRFVRIIDAKLDCIHNSWMDKSQKVMIVDDWDYLDSIMVYHDIPYEKRIISNIIEENLIGDPNIADCFQAPIVSSPYTQGLGGGVTLSSFASRTAFAREFSKTMSLMVPPEFRPYEQIIPKSAINGHSFTLVNGIDFRFAERPFPGNDLLSSLSASSYRTFQRELKVRKEHSGEYSVVSTLNMPDTDPQSTVKTLWSHFSEAVVTLPFNIDEFVEYDVEISRFQKVLNEDIWLQVVHSHQLNPRDDDVSLKALRDNLASLRIDFDVQLSDIHKDDVVRDQVVGKLISSENIIRLAQAFARSDDRDMISMDDYAASRRLMKNNFEGFIQNIEVDKTIKGVPDRKRSQRYEIVQTELISQKSLSISELFAQIESTGLFKDIYDLQEFLDWLRRSGHVIVTPQNKYQWV